MTIKYIMNEVKLVSGVSVFSNRFKFWTYIQILMYSLHYYNRRKQSTNKCTMDIHDSPPNLTSSTC